MVNLCYVCVVVSFQWVLVLSLIPTLVVKKLDKTLIARKRQDTLDMCRIFTEENEKLRTNHAPKIIKSYRKPSRFKRDLANNEELFTARPRSKRAVTPFAVNPVLNAEDAKRVETIVNKLYDDMEERGERVTYRQMETSPSSIKGNKEQNMSKPSRRFDFAPSFLLGPTEGPPKRPVPEDHPFPSVARWKKGIVPYFIDPRTYDAHLSDVIMSAFDYVEKATCIRLQKLREKPLDKASMERVEWLYISNPTGIRQCVHSNERKELNGVQLTVFGYDCMAVGDIVHEVMHILGYSHEHLRADRDEHISIMWDNIKPGYKKYFDLKLPPHTEYELGSLPYDYTSIMHYPPRAFSKNGQVTIFAEPGIKIGQREGLSEIDVEKVALIYSNECVVRNKEYLLQTCPIVVQSQTKPINATKQEIKDYFEDRLWRFGLIQYKIWDNVEFSVEERANILAVMKHIQQETCLQFMNVDEVEDETDNGDTDDDDDTDDEYDDEDTNNSYYDNGSDDDYEHADKMYADDADYAYGGDDDNNYDGDNDTYSGYDYTDNDGIVTGNQDPQMETSLNDSSKSENEVSAEVQELTKLKLEIPTDQGVNGIENQITNEDTEDTNEMAFTGDETNNESSELGLRMRKTRNKNVTLKKIKKLNIDAKKRLLRQAKRKRFNKTTKKQKTKQGAAFKVKTGTRRHSSSLLVLRRTAESECTCPEPGAPKGEKTIKIANGCFNSVNDLLHFFVHLLGLDHQHNMSDRDNYLFINWKNLTEDVKMEMQRKLPPAASVGFPYDYQSVMHYPWLQIKDGRTNLMYPIWNDGWAMGHWQGLSSVDVQKLNMLYYAQCSERQLLQ